MSPFTKREFKPRSLATKPSSIRYTLATVPLGSRLRPRPPRPRKSYKKSTALNAAHPGGVAKSVKSLSTNVSHGKKAAAASKYCPKVPASPYRRNRKLERDKDGIACER